MSFLRQDILHYSVNLKTTFLIAIMEALLWWASTATFPFLDRLSAHSINKVIGDFVIAFEIFVTFCATENSFRTAAFAHITDNLIPVALAVFNFSL